MRAYFLVLFSLVGMSDAFASSYQTCLVTAIVTSQVTIQDKLSTGDGQQIKASFKFDSPTKCEGHYGSTSEFFKETLTSTAPLVATLLNGVPADSIKMGSKLAVNLTFSEGLGPDGPVSSNQVLITKILP
ncbi:MAG: hypothetical protein KDD64_14870 [Bdellovibrionales bacterium]|nr:hypothetical protein [Bdellovibrionales bacterium]